MDSMENTREKHLPDSMENTQEKHLPETIEKNEAKGAVIDLTRGSVPKTLLRFSWPFMLSTLLQTLYSTVDTIVVGQAMGSPGLSAVGTGSQIMQLLTMFCVGFSNAGQILVAQYKGAGEAERIEDVAGTLTYLMVAISVILGAACVIFANPILRLMETPDEAFAYARDYLLICGSCFIFTGLYNMLSAILRGCGDSKHPTLFVIIASGLNLVLDLLFVLVFRWGVAGAAWATIIGQAVSVIFSFVFLMKHWQEIGFRFDVRHLRFVGKTSATMMRIGMPMAIQSTAIQISFLFVSRLVNLQGVVISAVFAAMQKLRNLPGILTQGLQLGITSMLGQNLGAQKLDRVRSTVRWGLLFTAIISTAFGLLFFLAPELCFRLFTQEEAVLAYAVMGMFTIIIELPSRVLMVPCNALVHAQGRAVFSLIIAFVDAIAGRIFLSWLLGSVFGWGPYGYFLGFSLATYITAIAAGVYYFSGVWKRVGLIK